MAVSVTKPAPVVFATQRVLVGPPVGTEPHEMPVAVESLLVT
jgi:hypothetical protein